MSNDLESNTDGDEATPNVAIRALQTVTPDIIRRRFALKFALVLVIMGAVLAGLGFTATGALSEQVDQNVRQEYKDLASQQATIAEKWIERNSVSIRLASQSTGLVAGNGQPAGLTIERLWRSIIGSAEDMYLVSTESGSPRVIAKTSGEGVQNETGIPASNVGLSWITDVGIDRMGTSEVRMSSLYRKNGKAVIGFLSPVQNSPNRYLVIEYDATQLAESLDRDQGAATQKNHFTQIVNADGIVQVDSRMADTQEKLSAVLSKYGNRPTVALAMENPGENATRTVGVRIIRDNPTVIDKPYAVGYASIEVADQGIQREWAIMVHAPTNDLFSLVNTVKTWGQIVVAVSVLLVGIVGASLGYSTASALDRLREKVEQMEEGNLDVEIATSRIDSIGRLYGGFASMRDALRQQIDEAEQARKEAEVARAEAMEMNEYLQDKAEEYSEIMSQCAAGDLTKRMDVDGENEAMDQIATDFNEMIEELEKTTGQLKHFADEVEEAGEVVETSAESVRDASEQVAESIQRISDDAHDQQERLEELSTAIDEAIEQFEAVAARADVDVESSIGQLREVADAINDLVELTDGMMAESENVAGAAEEQAAELNSVSQQANDLTRYARPLKDVLDSFETEEEHEFYFPTGPGSPQRDTGE